MQRRQSQNKPALNYFFKKEFPFEFVSVDFTQIHSDFYQPLRRINELRSLTRTILASNFVIIGMIIKLNEATDLKSVLMKNSLMLTLATISFFGAILQIESRKKNQKAFNNS